MNPRCPFFRSSSTLLPPTPSSSLFLHAHSFHFSLSAALRLPVRAGLLLLCLTDTHILRAHTHTHTQLGLYAHGAEAALCAHRWYFALWWQQFHAAALSSWKQYKPWMECGEKNQIASRLSSCSNDYVSVRIIYSCVALVVIHMSQCTGIDEQERWLFRKKDHYPGLICQNCTAAGSDVCCRKFAVCLSCVPLQNSTRLSDNFKKCKHPSHDRIVSLHVLRFAVPNIYACHSARDVYSLNIIIRVYTFLLENMNLCSRICVISQGAVFITVQTSKALYTWKSFPFPQWSLKLWFIN